MEKDYFKLFGIQFFADGEKKNEAVKDDSKDDKKELEEDFDAEFDDDKDEQEETKKETLDEKSDKKDETASTSEEEKKATASKDEEVASQEKKKQSKEENSKFAQQRREKEALEKAVEEAKLKGIREGIKQAYNGVNKFTEKPLTDDYSIEVFINQLEMEKKGLDPIKDYPDFIAEKNRAIAQKNIEEQKRNEFFVKDYQEFVKAHPEVSIESLNEDENFGRFAKGRIGNESLATIYNDYQEFVEMFNKKAKDLAKKEVAKSYSTPNPNESIDGTKSTADYFTKEQLERMTDKELEANWEKVEKSYGVILKGKK